MSLGIQIRGVSKYYSRQCSADELDLSLGMCFGYVGSDSTVSIAVVIYHTSDGSRLRYCTLLYDTLSRDCTLIF